MENDRLLAALGLCRKAGKLKMGFDAAAGAAGRGAPLVVTASDIADRTKRNITRVCGETVKILPIDRTSGQIEQAVGKRFVVAAVDDANLAQLILTHTGSDKEAQENDH
ncbi:MAG: 50S ribosomal protein L7ae [Oscillospiraceae bacterium]|nr:50S ribosomal protein L7ae [Oscillospiraceae bacterium]